MNFDHDDDDAAADDDDNDDDNGADGEGVLEKDVQLFMNKLYLMVFSCNYNFCDF